ncbi:hypothetical protein HPB50_010026 [Hyalomma asiaticum]|uniref:Uncharacterized protein n=1 Tax=Hyalomma asiaticum TaxID=266040 RepID=A0ACB7SV58_HYAAI|nr:hypothetical protein HPB50_010026 [Hyalomma asiaticum]
MKVCAEEKAEEADAKCRQCEIEAKMEKMMAAQSGLMDRIPELENALVKEREKTQAMGERLRLAEEELAMVVKLLRLGRERRDVAQYVLESQQRVSRLPPDCQRRIACRVGQQLGSVSSLRTLAPMLRSREVGLVGY